MSQWSVDPEPTWPAYHHATPPIPRPVPAHPQAVTALVLGLISLVACPVLGVAAVVVGYTVQRDCDLAPGRWSGRGSGTAGFVLGLVALSICACWIVILASISVAASG